jgi:hypothetical protein
MRRPPFALLALLAPLASGAVASPPEAPEGPAAPATIAVEEVRAGMKGWGESVFAGTAAERFDVEVLGVLRNVAPGSSYILGRLTGRDLERTGVVAGMSGSPVWIDGRLAGAVAFSWPFPQQAIAGITPIEEMRGIPETRPWAGAPGPEPLPLAELAAGRFEDGLWEEAVGRLASLGAVGGRSALLWGANGFSGRSLERLQAALPALSTAIGESSSPPETLQGGSSVAAVFVDGDLRLAATGTLTERAGDRVLAFGHPVAGLGEIRLPLATADVVAIVGSAYSSFKVANLGPIVGTFERDHAAGTAGTLGVVPPMVPLVVRVAAPEPREFRMRLADAPDRLAVFAAISAMASLDASTTAAAVRAVELELAVDLRERGRLELAQSFDGPGAANRAVSFVLAVVDFLARTDLEPVELAGIEVRLVPYRDPIAAEVVSAYALRTRLEPGEQTELVVELRGFRDEIERRRVPLRVPLDLPGKRYSVLVGDGASLDAVRLALEPLEPRTFEQARRLLESLSSARELVVLGLAPAIGTAAGGEPLPRLPPSVSAIWAGSGPSERPMRTGILDRASYPQERPLAGVARVELTIERKAPVEGADEGGAGEGRGKRGGNGG